MSSPVAALELRRRWVTAGLMTALALSALEGTIVATAVPQIVGDLGGFSLFGWVFSAYLLTQTVSIPVYGKLADLYGRKPVLLVGITIFVAASGLAALAWSMVALIVVRVVQGVGAGGIQATVQTVAGDLYPIERRGEIQAKLSSVWAVSALAGPVVGGILTDALSWRWIFLLNVPVGLVAMVVLARHLREEVVRRAHRIDVLGTVLVLAAAGLLIFGLLQGGVAWGWVSTPSLVVFAGALIAGALAVRVERQAAEPVLPPWLWRRRALVGPNLGLATLGLLMVGPAIVLPLYGQLVLGLGTTAAGFLLASMLVSWPVAAALSPRLYMRIGFRFTALIGIATAAVAAAAFVLLPAQPPVVPVLAVSLVLGVGCGMVSVPLIVAVQATVGWQGRGVVTSTAMFLRVLGQSVGAGVFAAIANTTLHQRLLGAPAALHGRLPEDVDGISRTLQRGVRFDPASRAYLGSAVADAVTHVYLGLAVVAAVGFVIIATVMPRRQPVVDHETAAAVVLD